MEWGSSAGYVYYTLARRMLLVETPKMTVLIQAKEENLKHDWFHERTTRSLTLVEIRLIRPAAAGSESGGAKFVNES